MPNSGSAVELEDIREVLRLYGKALCGREVEVLPSWRTSNMGPDWAAPLKADAKGVSMYLPPSVDRYPSSRSNFIWYKVLVTHQAGHLEFGSFDFSLERVAYLFPEEGPSAPEEAKPGPEELERFFDLFPERELAASIFAAVEDSRVDCLLAGEYAGIRPLYEKVHQEAIQARPPLHELPAREALVEALVRLSLEGSLGPVPRSLLPYLKTVASLARRVRQPGATVDDSAEATLSIYQVISRIPNVVLEEECCHHDEESGEGEGLPEELPATLLASQEEKPFHPPQRVEFRKEFLSQLAAQMVDQQAPPPEIWEEESLPGEESGPLRRDQPFSYVYPEWDFRAGVYKARWCRVREKVMEEGASDFYISTLHENHLLVDQVRSRFEHLIPELMRKVKRRPDGEEVELNALVEAVVDRRVGCSSSEKLYWRWGKVQRDVAVAFLLDMSATTDEIIEVKRKGLEGLLTGPTSYSAYLTLVNSSQKDGKGIVRKRVVDVEKEAAVLLIQALESIGDAYGIYTFSGSSRGNVEFFVIKDLNEAFSQRVIRRIDKIAPSHATRMGAAIRHAVSKLEKVEQKTRILFLISDGRPQDRDYGREPGDKDYAIRDTHMALQEARMRNIRPFCITVDREGKDYLKTMCQDIPYEVVARVEELPTHLLLTYPSLTA